MRLGVQTMTGETTMPQTALPPRFSPLARHRVAGRTMAATLALCAACGDGDTTEPLPPPTPAALSVSVAPTRQFYRTDQTISLQAEVTDATGAVIPDAPLSWTANPVDAIGGITGGETTLLNAGRVVLTACTGDGAATLCDDLYLLVDDGSPVLELTEPVAGAELGGDGATSIAVAGSVSDAGVARVFVNGAAVVVGDNGEFQAAVEPVYGVNHIQVVASDGVTDDESRELDVLWAESYLPAVSDEGRPRVALDDGIVLQLAQSFFDDGTPLVLAPPVETRDLADIVELVVANVDFADALPDPIIDNLPAFFLRVPAVRLGQIETSVEVTDSGAALFIRIPSVEADTEGSLSIGGDPLDLAGGILASLSIVAELDIAGPSNGAPVDVTLTELTVAVESAEGRFVSEEANAVFELAEGALRTTLEDELAGAVDDILASALPDILESALGALDTALRDQTIDIDTDVFPKLTIELDGRIGNLATALAKYLRAGLTTSVGVASPTLHPESRGVAQIAAEPGAPLFSSRPVQLAVRADFLNGLLQGLWNAGLLSFDATEILPEAIRSLVSEALVDGRLAPVLRPARGVEVYDLILELGQLELEMVSLDERSRFGLSVEAGVNVNIADNAISLDVAEAPSVRVWLIESEAEAPRIDATALREILLDVLWPELRETLADSLSIDLPALDVGDLTDIAPALEGFALAFEMEVPVDLREGFLVFDVGLIGRLPSM